jgi:hypothetical protein
MPLLPQSCVDARSTQESLASLLPPRLLWVALRGRATDREAFKDALAHRQILPDSFIGFVPTGAVSVDRRLLYRLLFASHLTCRRS